MRIVSLLASGTELVAALGAVTIASSVDAACARSLAGAGPFGSRIELVGRSHECDHPAWVRRLPVLSRPTFEVDGSSGEIDRRVREKLRAGQPLYQVDEAALAALAPDVVITQTHCEVCAVGPEALAGGCGPRLAALQRQRVAAFRAATLDGVLADFERSPPSSAGPRPGASWWPSCAPAWSAGAPRPPRCPAPGWSAWNGPTPRSPWATGARNWWRWPGVTTSWATAGVHSRAIDWQDVLAADPEVLVIAPCGFALDRARRELPALTARQGGPTCGRCAPAGRSSPTATSTSTVRAPACSPPWISWQRCCIPGASAIAGSGRDYEKIQGVSAYRGLGAVESGRYGKRKVARPRSRRSRARDATGRATGRRDR